MLVLTEAERKYAEAQAAAGSMIAKVALERGRDFVPTEYVEAAKKIVRQGARVKS